ncbi:MAG: ATP synthase F1 subunit gamma [Bacteroidales bacterium]|nr:ATP synthase F1 subunit gamma [Bacteroidales bacterium]
MANLKEIRVRLNSVKSTRQITSAMKMVSAAKLRRAQDTILQMRPFSNKLQDIYKTVQSASSEPANNVFFKSNPSERVLLVIISSNRGLCGGFNSNVVKKTNARIAEKYESEKAEKKLDIICIGKKGWDGLKSKGLSIIETQHDLFDELTFENANKIADRLIADFMAQKYNTIELIYNQFRNAAVQDVVAERFLPVFTNIDEEEQEEDLLNFIYEPSAPLLLETLIPLSLHIRFHKALLDSWASEHGARMTAMHKATDNATDFIRDLHLTYNKARQAAITKELTEIVSGANALKG